MKTKNLKLQFVIIAILFSFIATAQIVEFDYDETGNRILRDVIYLKSTTTDSTDIKQLKEYELIFAEMQVTISPNPNGGRFRVKIENSLQSTDGSPQSSVGDLQLLLHGINGVLIYENNNAGLTDEIDISEQKNGTYILSFIIGTDRKTWKIIKQE